MKYRLRKVSISRLVIIFLLTGTIFLFSASFYLLRNNEASLDENKTNIGNVKKSKKITKYIESIPHENFVEEIEINKEVSSVLVLDEKKYEAHIFDYKTGKEEIFEDLIKEDKKDEFWEKINELIDLKYPSFIADVLKKQNGKNVYNLKDNELIIYFYDYEITPQVSEDLYLKVNYNEIKDFLDLTVKLDKSYENEDGLKIDENKKLISLTFDDGPSGVTKELVDTLSNNKAKATFFMVGNRLNSLKDTVLYVHNSGNEIGYHSYAHTSFKRESLEKISAEFEASNEILKSITGDGFNLTRPPYGAINESVKNTIDTAFILWNKDTEDWRYRNTDYLVDYVLNHIQDGDILLFHDLYKTSVEAIKIILPELYVRGYQVVMVSDLAKSRGITIEKNKVYSHFPK